MRLIAYFAVAAMASTDAQWQFGYFPLWAADFPISAAYLAAKLPTPFSEAVIGPLWWFVASTLVAHMANKRQHR